MDEIILKGANLMFMRFIARVLPWLFSLLLLIFPSWAKYSPDLDVDKSVASVIAAIKTRDIDTIEAFMCKNIKDNVPNLRTEIENLIDGIQGNITSVSSESSNDFLVSSGGKTIEQATSNSHINTSIAKYQLNIIWEFYNNFSLAERGIRHIELHLVTNDGYESIVWICATEGIWSVHN